MGVVESEWPEPQERPDRLMSGKPERPHDALGVIVNMELLHVDTCPGQCHGRRVRRKEPGNETEINARRLGIAPLIDRR